MKQEEGMRTSGAVVAIWSMVLLPCVVSAQTNPSACTVEIQAPTANSQVGENQDVSGIASIPPGTKLWIFAHRKGLALWWPQGSGPAEINQGKWKVVAYFGVPRDIGSEFEITARVVNAAVNKSLEEWVITSEKSGRYPGISMPEWVSGCIGNTVTVKKTS